MSERGFEWVKGYNGGHALPARKTRKSAGYDFFSNEDVLVPALGEAKVKTKVKAYMPEDEHLELFIRSSYGIKYGLQLANCVGIIDSDYYGNEDNDGEIQALILNRTNEDFMIKRGDSFMQGIFLKHYTAGDSPTSERKGGVGSTGK